MTDVRPGAAAIVEAHAADKVEDSSPLLAHPAPVAVIASAFAVVAFVSAPTAAHGLLGAFMAAVLVVLAATDLERRIIPNRIVLPATAITLVVNLAFSPDRSPEFILAAMAVGIAFLIPNLINQSLMGMGDIKLVVLFGAGLGWGAVGAIMIGFLSVVPFALLALIRGGVAARKTTLPFGPFLGLGGLVILIVPHLIGG
jgi:prepilin signal peptidase PulO-like enzyme (type II secretory pathway)